MALNNRAGLVNNIRNEDVSNVPCLRPTFNIVITYEGNVLPCCNDYFEMEKMGNVKNNSLVEIWNNPRFIKMRKDLLAGKRQNYKLCKNCNKTDY